MAPLTKIQAELHRLQRMTNTMLALAGIAVIGFASFALYEVWRLHSQQTQLEQLTGDLCATLERAGILIMGSRENPCER